MNRKVNYYSWEKMDFLHRKVAQQIKLANFSPDIIIGVLRCGLIPAIHLSYLLGIDNVGSILVRTTPSDDILVEKNIEPILEFSIKKDVIYKKKILLVDTIMASGTTINICKKELLKDEPTEVKLAIIVDWPNSPYKLKEGMARPKIDFVGEKNNNSRWPDFPWEH